MVETDDLVETASEQPAKKKRKSEKEKLWGAIPESPHERFSYKPWCAGCSAENICTGCIYPRCRWCLACEGRGKEVFGTCRCFIHCKSLTTIDLWLQGVGGLDIAPMRIHQPPIALPKVIPIVDPATPLVRELPPWTYAIPVSKFIRKDGSAPPYVYKLKELFAPGSQLILSFFCQDKFLEPVWTNYTSNWWQSEWMYQFDAVFAVNFSVYWDDPMMEILSAIKRTMIVTKEIADAGHKVIPIVIWYTEKETREQLDVLAANDVHTIVTCWQYVAGAQVASYKHDFAILEKIAVQYPNLRIICYGMSAAWVIHRAREILGNRLIIANGHIFFETVNAATAASQRMNIFWREMKHFHRLVNEGADPSRDWLRPLGIKPPADVEEEKPAPEESAS